MPSDVDEMIGSWTETPAFVVDRYLNVLAANRLAAAVSPLLAAHTNLARGAVAAAGGAVGDDDLAHRFAVRLRESLRRYEWDGVFEDLVGDLSEASHEFAEAWSASEDESVVPAPFRVRHDQVGPIALTHQQMTIPGHYGLTVIVLRAVDDESRSALGRLVDSVRER